MTECRANQATLQLTPENRRLIDDIMEAMHLYPIAVARLRVAGKDFVSCGCQLREGALACKRHSVGGV